METTEFNTVICHCGCETWTYNKKIKDKLLAFEMYCYSRILRISWTERKMNREIREKLRKGSATRAIQRKLQLFGHICRMEDNKS